MTRIPQRGANRAWPMDETTRMHHTTTSLTRTAAMFKVYSSDIPLNSSFQAWLHRGIHKGYPRAPIRPTYPIHMITLWRESVWGGVLV